MSPESVAHTHNTLAAAEIRNAELLEAAAADFLAKAAEHRHRAGVYQEMARLTIEAAGNEHDLPAV
jgi:hypothetical protein